MLIFWPCVPVVTCNYLDLLWRLFAFNKLNDDDDDKLHLAIVHKRE